MITEAQIKHFLTHVSQGIQYHDQRSMWCGCLDLYQGQDKAVSPERLL